MKKIIISTVAILSTFLIWAVWPDDKPKVNFVKNENISVSIVQSSFIEKISITPLTVITQVPVSQPIIAEIVTPTIIPTPIAAIEQFEKTESLNGDYTFEQAWHVLEQHFQYGVSQQALAEVRERGLAADLPIKWLFGGKGDEYYIYFMQTDKKIIPLTVTKFQNDQRKFIRQLSNCMECNNNLIYKENIKDILNYSNRGYFNFKENFELETYFKPFYAISRLMDIKKASHLSDSLTAFEKETMLNRHKNDIHFLLSSSNEILQTLGNEYQDFLNNKHDHVFHRDARLKKMFSNRAKELNLSDEEKEKLLAERLADAQFIIKYGSDDFKNSAEMFKAGLLADNEKIKTLALSHESISNDYIYYLMVMNPIPQKELYDYLIERLNKNIEFEDFNQILNIAYYHAHFYSVEEAASLLDKIIIMKPELSQRVHAISIRNNQNQGVKRLSDKWLAQEKITGEIFEGKNGEMIEQEKAIKLLYTTLFKKNSGSAEELIQKLSRKFGGIKQIEEVFSKLNWPQIIQVKHRHNKKDSYGEFNAWITNMSMLNQAGIANNFDSIDSYATRILNTWNHRGGNYDEILYIFPQLTQTLKTKFIETLEKDNSAHSKILLNQLNK